jgi:hypothetical protein
MAFTTTSKFVQITPYLLMEYMYADEPTPESYFVNTGTTTVGYEKLVNGYLNNNIQIFNPEADYSITHNTADDSVVKISESSFVTLDSNLIIPFNDYSDELTNTSGLPVTFPSNLFIVYDTVRYHIRAGYNLNNIDGIVMSVEYQDQDLSYVTVSQIVIKKGSQQFYVLNSSPINIGANIYDKYFEIKIPNLKDMGDKYLAASGAFKTQTLASLISKSGEGFVYGAPLRINAWQIQNIVDFNGYERYNTAKISTLSLEQEDPFSNIGAEIKESDQGQFFEYYATDNEGFVEDFILFQNSIGNGYYISHEIEVLEQIGAALIKTSQFQSIQTTAYDSPNYYRPIVKNAGVAVSFMLRYTMSLINSINQSRITRISTYTSNNPSQWGTNITPLQLSNFPQVQKIYNRVYSQPQINVSGGSTNIRAKEIVKYVNIFVDQNFVTATASSLKFVNNKLSSEEGAGETTAYGTGKLTFSISPFDNFYKFSFVKSGPSGDPVEIDLSNSGKFNISFINPRGNKIQVPSLEDKNLANPVKGELAFKIDESISTQILQVIDRRFFITNGTTINPPVEITNNNGGAGNNNLAKNVQGAIKSVFENNNNINASTNNTSSVMYWGYWKKEGEEDLGRGEIILNPVSISTSGTSGSGFIGTLESPATPSIKGIKPASGTSGTASIGSPSSSITNQILTGAVLIASLGAEMAGYKATGWTDISIVDYFLIPGNPGYIKYPNITVNNVITAGNNILAPGTINDLQARI